jgi:hypothetical protein
LLREIRIASAGEDAFGILYGVRRADAINGDTINLVATRGRAGLDPLGIFAFRIRGEVFLTEQDLERFEKADACVALVIAGENAGFFVRDDEGSLETVRSYEEFPVHGIPIVHPFKVETRNWKWAWSLALLPLLFLIPRHPTPLSVNVREDSGQLRISWNRPGQTALTIVDGGQRIDVPLDPQQSTLTYARKSDDVTVEMGSARARYVGAPTELELTRTSITELESKVSALRAAHASANAKIAALQSRLK